MTKLPPEFREIVDYIDTKTAELIRASLEGDPFPTLTERYPGKVEAVSLREHYAVSEDYNAETDYEDPRTYDIVSDADKRLF